MQDLPPQIHNLKEIRTLHFNQTVFNLKKTAPPLRFRRKLLKLRGAGTKTSL